MIKLYPIFKSKYFYLLSSIISYVLIAPLLISNQISNIFLSILFSSMIVFCVNIISHDKKLLIASLLLGTLSIVTYWDISLDSPSRSIFIIHNLTHIIFLFLMTYYVIRSVSTQKTITKETLLGAISGYFLLGLTWTYIYLLLNNINPLSFTDHTTIVSVRDHIQHFIYYSFETLTTLGFGDILPMTDIARTFSWLEALTGQVYLAVWISQLVGLRIAQLVKMT